MIELIERFEAIVSNTEEADQSQRNFVVILSVLNATRNIVQDSTNFSDTELAQVYYSTVVMINSL